MTNNIHAPYTGCPDGNSSAWLSLYPCINFMGFLTFRLGFGMKLGIIPEFHGLFIGLHTLLSHFHIITFLWVIQIKQLYYTVHKMYKISVQFLKGEKKHGCMIYIHSHTTFLGPIITFQYNLNKLSQCNYCLLIQ